MADPSLMTENRVCPGCKKTVVTEDGGVVVAFGQSLFHVDCFKCAKCQNQVTADTNLLLLSDGSPVCANCSYCCNVCGLPILDEAIMTGDDSYHAHCFNCKVCKKRIDELVFAKTSQGIYCMDCHNERVARSRRHQQRKEREKARERAAAVEAGSSRSRDNVPRDQANGPSALGGPVSTSENRPTPRSNASLNSRSGSLRSHSRPSTPRSVDQSSAGTSRTALKRESASSMGEHLQNPHNPNQIAHSVSLPASSSNPSTLTSPPASINSRRYSTMLLARPSSPGPGPPNESSQPQVANAPLSSTLPPQDHLRSASSPVPRAGTLGVPSDRSSISLHKRRSFDDRPLNVLLKENTKPSARTVNGTGGLLVPNGGTSRKEKRRSINPMFAMSFSPPATSESSSPTAPSFAPNAVARSETPPMQGRMNSPLRDAFPMQRTLSPPPIVDNPGLVVSGPASLESSTFAATLGRSRSASSTAYSDRTQTSEPSSSSRPPLKPSITLDRVPTRTSSRTDHNAAQGGTAPGYHAVSISPIEGRMSPSLSVLNGKPASLRSQKSFDDRPRTNTPTLRNSASSLGLGQTIELPARSRSSSRPTSPAHKVDVPHGVESGTDTEAEAEEATASRGYQPDNDLPPLPPPKEGKGAKVGTRPPELTLNMSDFDNDHSDFGLLDSEDLSSELSHEDSPVQQTSHATFIAPALPPIRFSMTGADFSDLLKSVSGVQSFKSLDQVAEVHVEGGTGLKLDIKRTPPPSANNAQLSTPTSETTVLGSDESYNDATPVKRREAVSNNGETDSTTTTSQEPPRSHSPSPLSSAVPSNDQPISRYQAPTKHSMDGQSDPSHISHPSLDLLANRIRTFSGTRNGLPPRPSLDARPINQRNPISELNLSSSAPNASTSLNSHIHSPAQITLTSPDHTTAKLLRPDTSDLVRRRLQEAVSDANARGATHVKLNMEFIGAILMLLDQRKDEFNDMKGKFDGMKRASQQYMDGLTVAQTEYDKELQARRDAEAEVTRLRVLLSGQAVRLSVISGETKRQEAQKQLSREMSDSLSSLERDLSKLKVERDLTLAEVEELSASKSSSSIVSDGDSATTDLGRALSMRFDNIKHQYANELVPLTKERETVMREIAELKASRDAFLEETTMLNARNEELAQLNAQYVRRMDMTATSMDATSLDKESESSGSQDRHDMTITVDKTRPLPSSLSFSVSSSTVAFTEESADSRFVKISRPDTSEAPVPSKLRLKWPGSRNRGEQVTMSVHEASKAKAQHSFQQTSVLRFARCDHCGDKMWGSQLRCANCNISVHPRCVHHVHLPCSQQTVNGRDDQQPAPIAALGPSLFGRDLAEQVRADSRDELRFIPVIVEKCIDAVDFLGLEYEGIYRKTGGSRLSKIITQLFERGDYVSFDLRDTERFNDICSITSVFKTYFRTLPDPLFTYALHDNFIAAATIKDPAMKSSKITELINELPREHYHTTRALMLHLHRVCQRSETNLMHARNLGVVFGPTLMRSRDPNAEFSDMAGKALSVEWLVENAPVVFEQSS